MKGGDRMELDSRKLQILRAIVDEYILSASPVGSKSLSSHSEMKWSSATIRNEMADLETLGYLAQPHTSAGRIPSEKAYRLYVDQMMQRANLSDEENKLLFGYFREHVNGVDAVLRETAKALSEITHYTAVVMMPDIGVNRLKYLQLIPLTDGKALAVVVTDAGVSQNTVIDVPADIGPDELDRISKAITARFHDAMLPIALYHVGHILLILRIAVLRSLIARHLAVEGVTTMLHHHATALKVLRGTILSVVLALSVWAHLLNHY